MTSGFVTDIKKAAKDNEFFRHVVFTTRKSQVVLMSLRPGEEIGTEVHDGDQILYIVEGEGLVVMEDSEQDVEKGSIIVVPTGVRHNVTNTDDEPLKLLTIYTPPQHAAGTIQPTREEAQAAEPALA